MKTTTILALALGLLIAMIPAAVAFQPLQWQPTWGQPLKGKFISAKAQVQFPQMHSDYQIGYTRYGTKWGGDSLRKRISVNRWPGSYMANTQLSLARQQGGKIQQTVKTVEGQPGSTTSEMTTSTPAETTTAATQ
ncbi:MAG: hypothetical protein AABX47_00290 [Nanoarchaeota archaeon]